MKLMAVINTMYQTRIQTASVEIPGVEGFYFTLEKRPISNLGDNVAEGNIVSTTDFKDGTVYKWFHNGDVERVEVNGTKTIWWAAPTMSEVINLYPYKDVYCRFYPNGAITMKANGFAYYWGPSISGNVQKGSYWITSCGCNYCYSEYLSDISEDYYMSDGYY